MYIARHNFKSYAGTIKIGVFHPCFTSIVGPNGSGKSNVIDALLFVFGKRAAAMRLKKVSDLIHRSADHTNLNECSVTVYFSDIIDHRELGSNDASYTAVPNTELIIRRVADQSSTTTYYVNNQRSTWSDVTALFKRKGIDLDNNRFLILQGEVEAIAMMKAKSSAPSLTHNGQIQQSSDGGLLEFLDEIIGTNRYSDSLNKSIEYIEILNYQRNERLNRLKLIESECLSLIQSYKQALKYQYVMLQANKLKLQQKQLAQYNLKRSISSNESVVAEKKSALCILQSESSTDEQHELDTKKKLKSITKQQNECQQQRTTLKQQYDMTVSLESKYNEQMNGLESNKQKLTSKYDKLIKQQQTLQKSIDSNTYQLPQYETRLAELGAQLSDAELYYNQLYEMVRGKTEKFQIELEQQKILLIPYKDNANKIQQSIDVNTNEINEINNKLSQNNTQLNELNNDIESTSNKINKLQIQLNDNTANVHQHKLDIDNTRHILQQCTVSESDLNKQRGALLSQLQESRSASQQSTQTNTVVDQLMKCQRNKTITGIYGRLGDLATIDSRYDIAISTACPSLNHIVVDTTLTASKCVTYLKANKLGRATFICLDKQTELGNRMYQLKQTPDNIPRLFDLIQCLNEELLPAFYYAIKDTLVCDTLEQATTIGLQSGKQRYRVVTLNGAIVDIAGTMSGGGNKPIRGLLTGKLANRQKSSKSEDSAVKSENSGEMSVAEIQQQISVLDSKLNDVQQKKHTHELQLKQLMKQLNDTELTVKKQTIELADLKHTLTSASKRLATLNKSGTVLSGDEQSTIKKLRDELQKYQQQLAENNHQCESIEQRVSEIQDQIQCSGGKKLMDQQRIVDAYKNDSDECSKQINKLQHTISSEQKKLGKLQSSDRDEIQEEISICHTKLAELQSVRSSNIKQQDSIETELNSISKQLIQLNDELAEYEIQYNKLVNALEAKREQQNNLQSEITRLDTELYAARTQIKTYAAQCDALINDIHDEIEQSKQYVMTDITDDIYQLDSFTQVTDDELSELDGEQLNQQWTDYRNRIDSEQLSADQHTIDTYHKKHVEYVERIRLLDTVTHLRDECRQLYMSMKQRRISEFMIGYSTISLRLKEMYQMLTLGGDAELELVDSLDPYSEGVLFSVRPPKKSWKQIGNLSGGEKTLSSLALIFALHTYKPTPLYVMDEIDAALDFRNVSIVGNYLCERTKDAQFIVISLRNNMFELADRLVGIYKTNNTTKSVTIDPHKLHMPQPLSSQNLLQDTTNTTAVHD